MDVADGYVTFVRHSQDMLREKVNEEVYVEKLFDVSKPRGRGNNVFFFFFCFELLFVNNIALSQIIFFSKKRNERKKKIYLSKSVFLILSPR